MNVKTLKHIVTISEKVAIPVFKEFGASTDTKIEFFVCQFHNQYNGLIGNNILRQMKAIINMKDNILKLEETEIPIRYTNDGVEYYFEKKGLHKIMLPVEQKNGLIYNPQIILNDKNIEIMEGVYEAENYNINAFVQVNGNLPQRVILETQDTDEVTPENFYTIELNEKPDK